MKSIDQFLINNNNNKVSIVVIGDSVLDEYYNVQVKRISPEFPTQIMLSSHLNPTTVVPGGAANVCLQMSNGFNVDCYLFSFIDGRAIDVFKRQPFDSSNCVSLSDTENRMPIKRRFYDGDYPLPRWDIESPNYGLSLDELKGFQDNIFDNLYKLIENKTINIVVLSDYGKGLFENNLAERIIKLCNDSDIPTIVDPKDPPVKRWQGCTYFKPNAFEACKMTELPTGNWWKHEEKLNQLYGIKKVVITDGPNPPYCADTINDNVKLARIPNKQSVIGAGDCVCAFLAMSLAHKMSLRDAVEIGWNASSLYIESKHNKPIMPYEFAKWNDPIRSKIVSVDEMKQIMGYSKKTWIWTNGCFDIVHGGHLRTLEAAKQLGNKVIVGLNTDESVKKLKGNSRPINNYSIRAEHLAHCQYVDFIVPIEDDTPQGIIEYLRPTKIVKGNDYKVEQVAGADVVGHENVHLINLVEGLSTTRIIERIKS